MIELLPDALIGENRTKMPSARSLVQKFRRSEEENKTYSTREAAIKHRHQTVSRRRDGERAMQRLGLNPKEVETDNLTKLTMSSWCHIYFDTDVVKNLSDDAIEIWGRAAAQLVIEHIKKTQK